jgi:hypothetical protein
MSSENRKTARRFVRQGARMVGADGSALGACLMINLSGAGAHLKVEKTDALPDEFVLLLSHDGQLRRQCTVAWRSETAIGVRFPPNRSTKRK